MNKGLKYTVNKSRDFVLIYPEPRTQQWGLVRGFLETLVDSNRYVKQQHLGETELVYSTRRPVSSAVWVCLFFCFFLHSSPCRGASTSAFQSPEECVGERLQQVIRLIVRPECVSERPPDNKSSALTIVSRDLRGSVNDRQQSIRSNIRVQYTVCWTIRENYCWTISLCYQENCVTLAFYGHVIVLCM